jgi:integrase
MSKHKWFSSKYPGVRYREHQTRKNGVKKDRYFVIRYQLDGKRKEERLGWASEGWTAEKANIERASLKKAHLTGEGAESLQEKREIEKKRREAEALALLKIERDNMTVSDIWDPYEKSNSEKKSISREISMFNVHIKPVIGSKPLKNVAAIHLERIKRNMAKKGLAPRTIHYTMSLIRQMFNYAKRFDYFYGDNPVSKIKMPSFDNRRMRFLTVQEAEDLLEDILSRSEQTHNITLLSLDSGLRAGEIFSLTWGDVDINNGIITIRDSKSGKTRFAYMTQRVKEMFNSLELGEPSQLVFPDRKGNKIIQMSNAFNRAVDKLKLNEGIEDRRFKVTFHTCRHSFASRLVESGEDLYVVKELLGHSDFKMTSRYAHLGENTLQNAIKRLETTIPQKDNTEKSKVAKFER